MPTPPFFLCVIISNFLVGASLVFYGDRTRSSAGKVQWLAYSRCSFRRLAQPSFSSVRRRTRPHRLIATKATMGAPCSGVVALVPAGIACTMVTDGTRTAGRVFRSSHWKLGYRSSSLPFSPFRRPRGFHSHVRCRCVTRGCSGRS